MDEIVDIKIEPPSLVVKFTVSQHSALTFECDFDLDEVLKFESEEAEIEIVDSHWHGIVLDVDGETEHFDLRDLDAEIID